LKNKISKNSNYLSEIAVKPDCRINGVGTALGLTYLSMNREKNLEEVVLRTDERNDSSMGLFRKLGFICLFESSIQDFVRDKDFYNRIYLKKSLKNEVIDK